MEKPLREFIPPAARPKAERVVIPEEVDNAAKTEHQPLHNTFIELETIRRHLPKKNDVNTIDSLKAELNTMSTEDYLANGRGQENIQRARQKHLEKEERHEQQMARGAEIRRARMANISLLDRFKKSLATMNERLFGDSVRNANATPDNEKPAKRPE